MDVFLKETFETLEKNKEKLTVRGVFSKVPGYILEALVNTWSSVVISQKFLKT